MKHEDHEDHEGKSRLMTVMANAATNTIKRLFSVVFVVFVVNGLAFAQVQPEAAKDPATEARLKVLAEELRCLVCQNQTIADSNAPLAVDLRGQIRGQIAQGRSDDQIRAYMVERYGDFVLYRPPFKATTALLWVGPFALVAAGVAIFLVVVRRRKPAQAPEAVPAGRRREIEKLLEKE